MASVMRLPHPFYIKLHIYRSGGGRPKRAIFHPSEALEKRGPGEVRKEELTPSVEHTKDRWSTLKGRYPPLRVSVAPSSPSFPLPVVRRSSSDRPPLAASQPRCFATGRRHLRRRQQRLHHR